MNYSQSAYDNLEPIDFSHSNPDGDCECKMCKRALEIINKDWDSLADDQIFYEENNE